MLKLLSSWRRTPDGPGGELIRGWAGLCEEVRRSRVQIWRDIRAGQFPPPIETGPNSIAWFRSEIEAWKRSRPRRTYGSSQTEWSIPRTASPPVTSGGRSHRDDLRVAAEPGPSLVLHPPATQAESWLHRQYLVQQVHGLGARVMFELLDEIARHPGFGDDLNQLLERYAAADGTVRAVARAPARELRHGGKFSKRTARCRGTVSGRAAPTGCLQGRRQMTANRRPRRVSSDPLYETSPADGRPVDHDGCDSAPVDQRKGDPGPEHQRVAQNTQTRDWAASGERLRDLAARVPATVHP